MRGYSAVIYITKKITKIITLNKFEFKNAQTITSGNSTRNIGASELYLKDDVKQQQLRNPSTLPGLSALEISSPVLLIILLSSRETLLCEALS